MSDPIFPVLRQQAPVLDFFRQRTGVATGGATESQRQMAEEFRIGMATALGVPPEAIRDDLVQKWIVNWTHAFVKPEYWAEVAPTTDRIRSLGATMGEIVRSALTPRERLEIFEKQARPPVEEQPQRTKQEPYYSDLHIKM